ncbi:hypothetical protein [Uliginosibacterium sp. H1]|uniref:hypothetical protein n=1 Tax=Uliginosibacterium sp. H1 TaxID=3114757 RepID=UPI002E16E9D2|nr:hypothetical protein [Uliginosibacterium sp. H1]
MDMTTREACRRSRAGVASIFAFVVLVILPLPVPAQTSARSASAPAPAGEAPWPLTTRAGERTLSVYAPQLDSWDGFTLQARVAVQAVTGDKPPRSNFGVLNLEVSTLTDKASRMVSMENVKLASAEFPSASPDEAKAWSDAVIKALSARHTRIAMDRLESQLSVSGAATRNAKGPLKNDAPRIIFSQVAAMLIYIDGEPNYQAFAGTPYQRVINTRPLLLREPGGTLYLKVFDGWMSAASLQSPWTVVGSPPASLDAAFRLASDQKLIDPLSGQTDDKSKPPSLQQSAPQIYVATAPTELVVTDGPPKYVPVQGTQLLFVENTSGHVFKHIADNSTYVLISGRWFRATQETGPWSFVAANALPADFAKIPDDSAKENVKASVAGTPQAREAAISASVPQTAAVKVSGTTMEQPRFDGAPVLRPIAGTSLQYVVNTSVPVIQVDASTYFALQNGVWFTAPSLDGPWTVALSVPVAIYGIPPSSSLYYVTYVRIYGYGNGVVYVGYSPGYTGTYIDPVTGVVVYGTGYYYDPWLGTYWYGAPVTYGYGAAVAYTPWGGWAVGFCFGWAWGAAMMSIGWGWGPYPYWGPWAYPAWGVAWGARGGAVAWGPGGWAGYTGNIYSQWGNRATVSRAAGGYNAWTGNAWAAQVGRSYNSRTGIASAGQRGAVANVYNGNFAAGSRGVATGPGGNVVVGGRGIAGNAQTGNVAAGGGGAVYNKDTGQWTTFGHHTGAGGGQVAHVGDNVYAGRDGNVYRHTDGGWEQHTGNGWSSVPGSAQGEATRQAGGGLGAERNANPGASREAGQGLGGMQQLDRDRAGRELGAQRAHDFHTNNAGFGRSFGGGGGRFGGGGHFGGGGFRGRR